jgi:hypothetical protein
VRNAPRSASMRVNATVCNRICPHPDGLRESVIFVQCCPSYKPYKYGHTF